MIAPMVRGDFFEPLYKHAGDAAIADPAFYELLSSDGAVRDGSTRERKMVLDLQQEGT